jgi:hypothetical protein
MVMFYSYVSLPEGIIPTILHKSCIIPMKTTSFRHVSPPIDSTGNPAAKKVEAPRETSHPNQPDALHPLECCSRPDRSGELLVLG